MGREIRLRIETYRAEANPGTPIREALDEEHGRAETSLERWKTILLTIGAVSTFLTFFVPFLNQREQQMDLAFSETLKRLGDDNPALRASATIDLVRFYEYQSFSGLGSPPYRKQVIFVLQSSLKKPNESDFVRQATLQAIIQTDPLTLEGAWLKGADLSNLDLRNLSFKGANLAGANLSGAESQSLGLPRFSGHRKCREGVH